MTSRPYGAFFPQVLLELARQPLDFAKHTVLRPHPAPQWATPNVVLHQEKAWQLREFFWPQATNRGEGWPVLVIPPEINHSAIVDFAPNQSLIRTLLQHRFRRVAAIEWFSATEETASRDVDDSLGTILDCVALLGGRVHLIGVCQGGWEAATAAALQPEAVATLTLVAAPINFHVGLGAIQAVARSLPMSTFQALVQHRGGVMPGAWLSLGFDGLLPFERFGLKYLALWNHLGDQSWVERFHRIDDWYRFSKNLPGPLYLRVVRELFKENRLVRGRFVVLGQRIDLKRIQCPLALVVGTKDHITPPPQVLAARKAVSSQYVLEVEIPAGHVGTFMSHEALADHWPEILGWLRAFDPSLEPSPEDFVEPSPPDEEQDWTSWC